MRRGLLHPAYRLQRKAPAGFEEYQVWWPFMNALQRHTKPVRCGASDDNDDDNRDSEEIVWLEWRNWHARHGNARVEGEFFEAMELFVLFLQDDPEQWHNLVREIWTDAYSMWSKTLPSSTPSWSLSPPSFRIGLLLPGRDEEVLRQWRDHMTSLDDAVVSPAYRQMRAAHTNVGVTKAPRPMPVRLVFDDADAEGDDAQGQQEGEGEEDETSMFSLQLQECSEFVQTEQGADQPSPLFQVEQVDLNKVTAPLTGENLESLCQLATLDVRLCRLRLESATVSTDSVATYTKCLQELLAMSGSTKSAVRSVSVGCHATSQTYDAVFSALLDSRSIEKLSVTSTDIVDEEEEESEHPSRREHRLWQWIAAAVFSSQASNAIDHFVLDARTLALCDVRALETTLRGQDALTSLYQPSPGEVVHHGNQSVHVTASAFGLSLPPLLLSRDGDEDSPSSIVVMDPPLSMELRVLGSSSGSWLSVLLPGWGQAWVKQSDTEPVVKKHSQLPSQSLHSTRAVHHITIQFPDTSNQLAVVAFLRVVGRGCTRLTLLNWNDRNAPPTNDWFHSVFQACPNLKEISFDQFPFPSLSVIASAYETGLCRIQKLRLFGLPKVNMGSVITFVDWLADRDHAMARRLTDLTLVIPKMTESPVTLFESLLTMVEQNKRLAELTLSLRASDDQSLGSFEHMNAIVKHRAYPVAAQLAPLGMASKTAFLSVARGGGSSGNRATHGPRAVETLDSGVMARIFEFAAPCRLRSVFMHVSRSDHSGLRR